MTHIFFFVLSWGNLDFGEIRASIKSHLGNAYSKIGAKIKVVVYSLIFVLCTMLSVGVVQSACCLLQSLFRM